MSRDFFFYCASATSTPSPAKDKEPLTAPPSAAPQSWPRKAKRLAVSTSSSRTNAHTDCSPSASQNYPTNFGHGANCTRQAIATKSSQPCSTRPSSIRTSPVSHSWTPTAHSSPGKRSRHSPRTKHTRRTPSNRRNPKHARSNSGFCSTPTKRSIASGPTTARSIPRQWAPTRSTTSWAAEKHGGTCGRAASHQMRSLADACDHRDQIVRVWQQDCCLHSMPDCYSPNESHWQQHLKICCCYY